MKKTNNPFAKTNLFREKTGYSTGYGSHFRITFKIARKKEPKLFGSHLQ